ncbi:hypothetical protein NE237_025560 [Protea cynaroides]|uniref:Uncharacterized protein n=1 Tax=Protea cynaroides TaxID=273540 RepID=A0A9Q0H7A0_9MAGN|nr:hypothetical protein NE237_025560 [Protea cynaroides]
MELIQHSAICIWNLGIGTRVWTLVRLNNYLAEESVSVKVPPELEKEVASVQIVPSAIVDAEKVEKIDEVPDSDVPVKDDSQMGVSSDSKLDISSVPESVEKEPRESSKIPDVTESLEEALEKPVEHLEVSPTKDSEPEVVKEPEEVSVVEPKMEERPESVVDVKREPQEESQEFEEKSQKLEAKEIVDKDITIDGGTEDDDSLKEEVPLLEPNTVEEPESVVEAVGKPQEVEEVNEKAEILKPKESIDNDIGKDGETKADESL